MTVTGLTSEAAAPSREWAERYLRLLRVDAAAPSLESLAELIRAHKLSVPFTNVSAIMRRSAHRDGPVPPIDAEALLAGWEQGRAGGVCFELAETFYRLCVALGYTVTPIFGRVRNPGDHQAVLVELDGQRYIADVGSGMPALAPVPLSGTVEMSHAGTSIRFRPGEGEDEWLEERFVDGEWFTHFYFDIAGITPEERAESYQQHHTPGYNFVVTSLVVVRCTPDALFQLRGDTFTHSTAEGTTTHPVPGPSEAERLVHDVIGLPDLPVAEAMAALAALQVPA